MTIVEVIVRPFALELLKRQLDHPWISGMTVTEVKGHGRQRGHPAVYRGAEYRADFVPKLKVELVVPDPLVPRVLYDLERALRTGKVGDGKIFVTRIEEAVRVRTGERGEGAL